MRYVYFAIYIPVFFVGMYCGYKLPTRGVVEQPKVETMVTRTVTKEVVRGQGDKQVTERTTTKIEGSTKASTATAKPQYRLGALLPIGEPKDVSVTAARRVVGGLWVESQYNIKRKEILIGLSYEF